MSVPNSILWVDDQIDRYEPWMNQFALHGTMVEPSPDLADGLKKLGQRRYDIILLDLMMGHESCMHILHQIHAKAQGAKLFLCSSFFYLPEVIRQFAEQRPETQIPFGRIDKTNLPFTDDAAATVQFLEDLNAVDLMSGGETVEAPDVRSVLGDTTEQQARFPTWEDYVELDARGKIAALLAAAERTAEARKTATRTGARYLLFCGSWSRPAIQLNDLDSIPTQDEILEQARILGFAPFAFSVGGRVDDLTSGCSDATGLRGYPILRLTYRSKSEEVHFDTGNPYTLLSYEWYLEKGWLPVSRMFDMHTAGELELIGNHFRLRDAMVTDASGEGVTTTVIGFAVLGWSTSRLSTQCELDCTFQFSGEIGSRTCKFRTGLLGRNLARVIPREIRINCVHGQCFFVEPIEG